LLRQEQTLNGRRFTLKSLQYGRDWEPFLGLILILVAVSVVTFIA
jgi:hypothetical protein